MLSDWLPVPHYRQSKPGACLPACVRMVLAYLGRAVSESEVARLLGSKSFGTPAFHVRRLREWGYGVIDEIGSLALLRARVEARQPCIVFVRTEALPYWSEDVAHALVAESPKPEPELNQFNIAISRGTNNEETIKFRHRVLVRRFIEQYGPVEFDEDRIFGYDQKLAIFRKYDGVCQECGEKLEFGDSHTHYHHIDPYIAGGETEIENGLLVCQDCHLNKVHGSSSKA
jgi:5-methylcytosine-specific restriction endonuclease McrA